MNKYIYSFDELTIGGSLNTLLYSFVTNTSVIIDEPLPPFELEEIDHRHDFSFLGFNRSVPLKAIQVWDRLSFGLSMAGLVLFPNNIQSIREDDSTMLVFLENNNKIEISFNKINKFDSNKTNEASVYDWFDVRSMAPNSQHYIFDDKSNLANELLFYQSNRPNVKSSFKDLVAVSHINYDELHSIHNSESYVRLKAIKMMKDRGIKGTKNGYDPKGNPVHYAIKLEHAFREVRQNIKQTHNIDDLLSMPFDRDGDTCKMMKNLFRHKNLFI